MISAAFAALRDALEKAGVRYAIGGSWASAAFGEARFTRDVDIVADLTLDKTERFLRQLPETFYADLEDARTAVRLGRSFNVMFMPLVYKFDLFPARAFALGLEQLDRAILVPAAGLSDTPVPFVTPEDILLAKLSWFHAGGEVSEVQWRDIVGVVRACGPALDRKYLESGAARLGVTALLHKALAG